MNFSTLQKRPLGKIKDQSPSPHSNISQLIETLNLPLPGVVSPWWWCPSFSTASRELPWSWEPNATWTLCRDHRKLWSFECKFQSKLLQEMPKSLAHSNDEKATSPCPRGNLVSCRMSEEITATNHWKLQNFFLEEIRATKWCWGFLHPSYSKCFFFFSEPVKAHLLLDG